MNRRRGECAGHDKCIANDRGDPCRPFAIEQVGPLRDVGVMDGGRRRTRYRAERRWRGRLRPSHRRNRTFVGASPQSSRRLLVISLEAGIDQGDLRVDGRMMQAVLGGDKLHELVGPLDVERAIL
jgi:hypothetical protein